LINDGHWSEADAETLIGTAGDPNSGTLSRAPGNNQRAALMNFLALYDVTQRDQVVNGKAINIGSWDSLKITYGVLNGDDRSIDVRTALFGDGLQKSGLISEVLIGGDRDQENPQRSIGAILSRLGVKNSRQSPHHNHFHVFLNPPEIMPIGGYEKPKKLQASSVVPSEDIATETGVSTLGETEMFMSLLVPLATPIYELSATQSTSSQVVDAGSIKPDVTLDGSCNVVQSSNSVLTEDMNGFFPAAIVSWYYDSIHKVELDVSKSKTTILQSPQHGRLVAVSSQDAAKLGVGPEAGVLYKYEANAGYLGSDDAVLLVELEGKKYKVHVKFYVVEKVNDDNWYEEGTPATLCAESKIKRVASLTFSQDIDLSQWGDVVQELATSSDGMQFNQYIATAAGVNLSFTNLDGGIVGQASSSAITLDTNAAGNGWFVDYTPWLNEEWLPTSNPYEWKAKEGSEAPGKMDLLSVLLHEYGHVRADSSDFMGTTLTASARRLPRASEMQLMANLVADIKDEIISSLPTINQSPGPMIPVCKPTGSEFRC